MFKQVLSAMVLTMGLAGAAFVSADSIQYSDNGDYKAAVVANGSGLGTGCGKPCIQ